MKIAVATDDHCTVSLHFGRAAYYEIFSIEDGKILRRQSLQKPNHRHTDPGESHREGHHHQHDHHAMMDPIVDCQILLAGGMGMGAYNALKIRSIEPFITDIMDIDSAINSFLAGTLVNHLEWLH